MKVIETEGTTLRCDADGDPLPELEWQKDGVLLTTTAQAVFRDNKKGLTLKQLRKEDSGLYECVAKNTVGKETTATSLIVLGMIFRIFN